MNADISTPQNLVDLDSFRQRAETAAKAAEEASNKANSDSGFAANAKKNAEEQAQAISQLRGQVDADMGWLGSSKSSAETASAAITSAKNSADSDAQIISDLKKKIEEQAAASDVSSTKCAEAMAVIERVGEGIDEILETVNQDAASISKVKQEIDKTGAAIDELHGQVEDAAAKVSEMTADTERNGNTTAENKKKADALLVAIEKASATANTTHERVAKYEEDLKKLEKAFKELHGKIEGLLPNATSAGLASAFRNQKERFKQPQRQWLLIFVVTILLLLGAGLTGLPHEIWSGTPDQTAGSWDVILRQLLIRLPLIAPLVWLGIYAGRNYMLALRLEEEYAFKEAVSTAFEGYKREMAGISGDADTASPLLVLCEKVLLALAQRPGRIYEGRHEDITPLSPVRGVLQDAQKVVRAVKGNDKTDEAA